MAGSKPLTEQVSANEIRRKVKAHAVKIPRPTPTTLDYAGFWEAYEDRAWFPFPLPAGKKFPPPSMTTGAGGEMYRSKMEMFARTQPHGNVGLRLDGVIGLDIDARDRDGEQWAAWAAWVAEHGELPATWSSTSRGADQPSRILYFRVPAGVEQDFMSKAEWGDVIQRNHRYAVVAPSIHPEGGQYRWYSPDGSLTPLDVVPALSDLPALPAAWVAALTNKARTSASVNNEPIVISSVDWDRSKATDALRDEAVDRQIEKLKALPRAWRSGAGWDQGVYNAACVLARIANSPWFAFDLDDARTVLLRHAPANAEWGEQEILAKLSGAIASTVGDVWFSKRVAARDAQGNPFADDSEAEQDAHDELRVFKRSELKERTPPGWLLEDLIQEGTTCLVAGPSNVGKSWLMLDWGIRIALGLDFHGRAVKQGRVLYVPAEGLNNFPRRMDAWEAAHPGHVIPDDELLFVASGVNLSDDEANAKLAATILHHKPDVLIFDTFGQLGGVASENDANDVQRALKNATSLRNLVPNATCLIVHHTGKAESGPRGTTVFQTDPDIVVMVKPMPGPPGRFTLSTDQRDGGKVRDGLNERMEGFSLTPVFKNGIDVGAFVEFVGSIFKSKAALDSLVAKMEPDVWYETKDIAELGGIRDKEGNLDNRKARDRMLAQVKLGAVSSRGDNRNREWQRVE